MDVDLTPFDRYREIVDDWDAFARALVRPLPVTIWANTLRLDPAELPARLAPYGLDPRPLAWHPGAFRLPARSRPGKTLPFLTGCYHVQEEVSLAPVALLDPRPGERVLDLCAAPGNKTVQTAVRIKNRGQVLANDMSRQRAGVMLRNVERLGITCVAAYVENAANLPPSFGRFDRVLADVPCSCEGTSRKNPEVVTRLQALFYDSYAASQLAILRKAFQLARPGGRVVYSTCTYAPEENEAVVARLLDEAGGRARLLPARLEGLRAAPGLTAWRDRRWDDSLEHAMRIYPHHQDTGGFFVAVIEKTA